MYVILSIFLPFLDAIYQSSEEDAPLPPGESLTLGYGTKQVANPLVFNVTEEEVVDVGFLKLFFSTEYLDVSAIPQESPFEHMIDPHGSYYNRHACSQGQPIIVVSSSYFPYTRISPQ